MYDAEMPRFSQTVHKYCNISQSLNPKVEAHTLDP